MNPNNTASAGKRLKELRLKKGLSLEEVQKKTKINLNVLKAIEEDNTATVLPVYLKGFLKIYCNFLGVDPKEFTHDYYRQTQQPSIVQEKIRSIHAGRFPAAVREKPQPVRKEIPVKITLLKPSVKRKLIYAVVAIVAFIILLALINKVRVSLAKRHARRSQVSLSTGKPSKTTARKLLVNREIKDKKVASVSSKPQTPVQSTIVQQPREKPSAAEQTGIMLGIRAKDDCWIQLKVDGKAVFQSILKKGRFELWRAKDKIELSLGNVGNVELELNGKLLMPLGRKGQVLKNIVITKEGLKIDR